MDPTKGPVMLSARQAAKQRAPAAALAQKAAAEEQEARIPPRSQTPVEGSSDDDDPNGEDRIWSQSRHYWRPNKNKPVPVAPAPASVPMSAPEPEPVRQPRPLTSPMNSDDEGMSEDQRRKIETAKKMGKRGAKASRPPVCLSAPGARAPTTKAADPQKAPAEPKPTTGAKAPKPKKGQESPETKVSHPMETRQRASGAGGLRSGGGSGQTGTCVARATLPKPES
jgi:hypothetical protein